MPSDSVDLVVTSPPYWGLRDYSTVESKMFPKTEEGKAEAEKWGDERVKHYVESTKHVGYLKQIKESELVDVNIPRRTIPVWQATISMDALTWGGDPKCQHEWDTQGVVKSDEAIKRGPNSMLGPIVDEDREARDVRSSFCSKCSAWRGKLGLEPSFHQYLDHLLMIFAEVKRVLKPTGAFYLNMGDTYSQSGGAGSQYEKFLSEKGRFNKYGGDYQPGFKMYGGHKVEDLPAKCLIGIPWRLAIRMVDEQGWIMRNDIIWQKLNGMPSSVKDRLTNHHEHIFFFVKEPKYYFDLDAIRVPHKTPIPLLEQRINADRKGRYKTKKNKSDLIGGPQFSTTGPEYRYTKLTSETYQTSLISPQKRADMQGLPGGAAMNHPLGKNPSDTIEFDPSDSRVERRNERYNSHVGQKWEHLELQGAPSFARKQHSGYFGSDGELLVNPDGKNPSDIIESHDKPQKTTREGTMLPQGARIRHGLDGSTLGEGHLSGKNPSDVVGYDAKGEDETGWSSRLETQKQERDEARVKAKDLFPDDPVKQQEYVNYVHDHGSSETKTPSDVFQSNREPYLANNHHTMRLHKDKYVPIDPSRPDDLSHPAGKNPGDIVEINGVKYLVGFRDEGSRKGLRDSGRHKDYGWSPENSGYRLVRLDGKNPSDIVEALGDFWSLNTEPFKEAHFAVMPLNICYAPILSSSPKDGVILDPFAGSGTLAEACELLNIYGKTPTRDQVKQAREQKSKSLQPTASRKWILLELNPRYCEIAEKRLSPYVDVK